MKRNLYFLLLAVIPACTDIFKEQQERIVGSLFVIKPNNEEDKGYRLIEYKDSINVNILNDYVSDIAGNDSILVVKGIEKSDCNEKYYLIHHHIGNDPILVDTLDEKSYERLLAFSFFKYRFRAEPPPCP